MVSRLEELCWGKVLIEVYTHSDVKKQIFSLSLQPLDSICKYKKWSLSLQEFVAKKNKFIDFPSRLIPSLPKSFINFVGLQMLKWSKFHKENFGLTFEFSEEFLKDSLFTSKGKIDEKKAAKELVKDPSLSTFLHYKIACYYYLTDIIPVLWQNLVDSEPDYEALLGNLRYGEPIREKRLVRMHPNQNCQRPVVMWSEYLHEKQENSSRTVCPNSSFCSFLKKSYCFGIQNGNPMAVEYAWKALMSIDGNWEEIELQTIRHFNYGDYNIVPSIFIDVRTISSKEFLLSWELETFGDVLLKLLFQQMRREKLKLLIQSYGMNGYCVLRFLLFWPYQYLFLDTADSLFEILSEVDFYALLQTIADLIEDSDIGLIYNYRQLLREFWNKSPPHFKEYVIAFEYSNCLNLSRYYSSGYKFIEMFLAEKLVSLSNFTADDVDNFQMIFLGSASDNFITTHFYHQEEEIYQKLVLRERFRLADLYIDCIPQCRNGIIKKNRKISNAVNFLHTVFKTENMNLIIEIINWVNAIGHHNMTSDIFFKLFQCSKIADLFMMSKISITFLNYIVMWYFQDSEKIEIWKSRLFFDTSIAKTIFSPNYDAEKFDEFLDWIDFSSREVKSVVENERPPRLVIAVPNFVPSVRSWLRRPRQ